MGGGAENGAPAAGFVVEFCGLPGAGKSTLADLTQEALTARGLTANVVDSGISAGAPTLARLTGRVSRAVEQSARHPVASAAAVRWVTTSHQLSSRDSAAITIQWLATERVISASRRAAGTWLLQEGMVQTLYTLLLRGQRDTSRDLLRSLPASSRADLLVAVDVPVEEALDRLAERPSRHSRTQDLPRAMQRVELRRGREVLQQVVRRMDVPTLRVVNDDDASPDELSRRVCGEVAQLQHLARPELS